MRKSKVVYFSLLLTSAMLLSGCQMMSDLFPFLGGGGEDAGAIDVPSDPELPDASWTEPGEGVASPDEWEVVKSVKFPVIYFSYDQCSLGDSEKRVLDQVAGYLSGKAGYGLVISGHCDERGSNEYNRALGEKRALAVKDYLVSHGVVPERLRTVSYGEETPAVEGHNEAAYAKNRRAELALAKMR